MELEPETAAKEPVPVMEMAPAPAVEEPEPKSLVTGESVEVEDTGVPDVVDKKINGVSFSFGSSGRSEGSVRFSF